MTNKLIRYYGHGHLHFITFSCYRRWPLLRSVRAKNAFVKILNQVRDRHGSSVVGYVVMPEHIHLLISEPGAELPPRPCRFSSSASHGACAGQGERSGGN